MKVISEIKKQFRIRNIDNIINKKKSKGKNWHPNPLKTNP